MKLNAQLDADVLALQRDDEVTCLLTFEAPVPSDVADRPGESLVVVVDRSGSMQGPRIEAVRASLHALVDRMKPQDTFGTVVFAHEAAVAIPTRPMRDHHLPSVHQLIESIHADGTTDLSAGYLLGLTEARRHRGATGATVLLLSDGRANQGVVDPMQVGQLAASARTEQITTGTVGIGTGYDETLLVELSTQSNGAHRFAFTADDAAAVVAEETGDLLNKAIVNAFVRIKPTDPALIDHIGTLHDVPRWVETDANGNKVIVIPLGDLYAGQTRELLVHFAVPAIAGLGLHKLATFTFEYVSLPDLKAEIMTWPMTVNVVPGDEAAGRIPNPTVEVTRLLVEATRAKKQASDALARGDGETAGRIMDEQASSLQHAAGGIDASLPNASELQDRLSEEAEHAQTLARSARERDAMTSRKSYEEYIGMEARGLNDKTRRDRTRGKRDF